MIQVAGAASLGEGRLSALRVSIFERRSAGTVFNEPSATTRLARMLAPGLETADLPEPTAEADVLAALGIERRRAWKRFLDAVPVHRWHRASDGYDSRSVKDAKVPLLNEIVELWGACVSTTWSLRRIARTSPMAGLSGASAAVSSGC
jgi:hypothetical protein